MKNEKKSTGSNTKKVHAGKPVNKKILAFLIAGVLAVSAAGGGIYVSTEQKKEQAEKAVQPQTVLIEKKDLEHSISVSGTIASAEIHTVTVSLPEAKIKTVHVKVGDTVKAGDVIATLETEEVERQLAAAEENLRLANAKAGVEISSAQRNYETAASEVKIQAERNQGEVENAKNQYNKAVAEANAAGSQYQAVANDRKSRETIAANTQQELNSAKAAVTEKENALFTAQKLTEEKKAVMDAAQRAYDMAAAANDSNAADLKAASDTALAEYNQAAANASQAQNDCDAAKQTASEKETAWQNIQTAVAEAKTKEAELQAASRQAANSIETAKTNMTKAEENKSDAERNTQKTLADQKDALTGTKLSASSGSNTPEQEVEKYQKLLEQCKILAPSDGVITAMSAKEGEPVKNGEIAVVQNNESYRVAAAVDQYDISDIEKGMKVTIKTATTGDEQMQGELTFISPTPKIVPGENGAAASNGDYAVEASIQQPSERLRIGMNAKLTILLKEKKGVLAVPGSCVQQDENGNDYILVSEGEGANITTRKIPVEYGMKTDYYVEITGEGLKENMKVVIPEASQTEGIAAEGVSDGK